MRFNFLRPTLATLCAAMAFGAAPAHAGGDLLVAPTRVVLDSARGTEVILNNIGSEPATYRISLEIKRMTPDGQLVDVDPAALKPAEQAALDMVHFSPRRVTLPPNQPQVVRLGVRTPEGLESGEYRVHLLFRAVPDAKVPASEPSTSDGVSIALTPIYGITIPVIVRVGDLSAEASIGKAWMSRDPGGNDTFNFDLTRTGTRSVYGEVEVTRAGVAEPLMVVRGIAVYPELGARAVTLPVPPELAEKLKGPVKIRYIEDREVGGATIAEGDRVVN